MTSGCGGCGFSTRRNLLLIAFIAALFFAILAVYQFLPSQNSARVYLAGQRFNLEVADTPFLQRRGLAGRKNILDDGGMLFLFDQPRQAVFWTKGMIIPIDIVWVRGQTVLGHVSGASPPRPGAADDDIPRFRSPEEVDRVIELRAGRAEELGLGAGQGIRILLP